MRIKKTVAPVLFIVLTGAMLIQLPFAIADRTSAYEWFNPIIDVRDILTRRYVTTPDEEKMQRATIEGMIGSLNDPHTTFIPPDRRADFDKELRGTYVGIGAEVNTIDGYLTIVSPMEGSPALEAGIMAGDIVLEIEGKTTYNEPIQESINRLMGAPNTPVSIRVRHLDGEEVDLTITRRRIVTRTVRGLIRHGEAWSHCVDEALGLAYVSIRQFTESTREELADTLNRLNDRSLNGLILDLRDNPGGSLGAAVQVADLFLDSGAIVSIRDRSGEGPTYSAHRNGTLPNFPIIVLVNGASASASEIVAGALQENGRAKVLGTRTFGKGSVQEVRELPFDQGMLKFTTAHYHLPSGRNLNRLPDSLTWGVDPDSGFIMPVSDEDYLKMIRARREFEIIRDNGSAPQCASPAWIRETMLDVQLAAAVEALQARVSGRDWPKPGLEDGQTIAFDQELKRLTDERMRLIDRLERMEERLNELQRLADTAGKAPLLPPDVDLLSGTVTIRDRHGNVIGTYRIDGGDVRMALQGIRLTPVDEKTEGR